MGIKRSKLAVVRPARIACVADRGFVFSSKTIAFWRPLERLTQHNACRAQGGGSPSFAREYVRLYGGQHHQLKLLLGENVAQAAGR